MPVIDNKFARVDELDDPRRCQAVVRTKGQCLYVACEGSSYCPMHNGHFGAKRIEERTRHAYNLAQYQARVDDFADAPSVKSLRGEIGVTRMLLERIIISCTTDTQLLIYAGAIGNLVDKINKLVVSCDRLEARMGMLLDKAAMTVLAGQFIEIISRYVDDPEALEGISTELIAAITNVNGAEVREPED
jgi:hypothetical protein